MHLPVFFLWVTLNNSMILSKTHFGNYLSSAPHRHWSCNATTLHVPAYFYWNLSKINWFLYVKYIPTCHVISNQYIPCFIHWFSTNITLWLHSQSSSIEFDLLKGAVPYYTYSVGICKHTRVISIYDSRLSEINRYLKNKY